MPAIWLRFMNDDDGAVTVDYMVLSATLIAVALGVVAAVQTGSSTLATRIAVAAESTVTVPGDER